MTFAARVRVYCMAKAGSIWLASCFVDPIIRKNHKALSDTMALDHAAIAPLLEPTCHSCDVIALVPLFHDPLLGQEGAHGHAVALRGEARACIHDDSPQVSGAAHAGDVQAVCNAFLHMHVQPMAAHIVVIPAHAKCHQTL